MFLLLVSRYGLIFVVSWICKGVFVFGVIVKFIDGVDVLMFVFGVNLNVLMRCASVTRIVIWVKCCSTYERGSYANGMYLMFLCLSLFVGLFDVGFRFEFFLLFFVKLFVEFVCVCEVVVYRFGSNFFGRFYIASSRCIEFSYMFIV